jgi:hypothetical protein
MYQVLHKGVIVAYDSVRDHIKYISTCLDGVLWLFVSKMGFCLALNVRSFIGRMFNVEIECSTLMSKRLTVG